MNDFFTYLSLGFDHILDPNALDHFVFIVALCAVYRFKEWKKVAVLVTAFTVGHSVTLALATFEVVQIPDHWIETLIPITILFTAIHNIIPKKERRRERRISTNYILALLFGLIHGMGFSNYLRALLSQEEQILVPLLSFNLGIEFGQLIIVAIVLFTLFISERFLNINHREWNLFLSGAAAGISIILLV